jgi:energy-coupling factor transport system ATP-binding protein
MRIVVNNLSYTYSPKAKDLAVRAINNISLTIEEGDFFGIIGRTGSGKSTFVQHLNGLIKTQKNNGEIKIGDFDLTDKKCDFKTLRAKVGMVFQYPEHQLFAENVFEDVAFGYKNYKSDATKEQVELAVKGALEEVGLDYLEIKDKSPFDLSGGQKRRVAIAGVIVTKPEVLVLDEPVAGLDPKGKREFIKLLKKLHRDFVKTIVIVSHDMDVVSENCNKIAVFKDGELEAVGLPKEIFLDTELVKRVGLDLPTTAKLTLDLREKYKDFSCDLTVDGFIREYLKIIGGEE